TKLFGEGTSAAQAYDKIGQLYAPAAEGPSDRQNAPQAAAEPAGDTEEWIDAQGIPRTPPNAFWANVRDAFGLAREYTGRTGQAAVGGLSSFAAEALAGPPDPINDPEYARLQRVNEQIRNPWAFSGDSEGFGPVVTEADEAEIAANEAKMRDI